MDLHLGDCIEVMRGFADNSVDAIVTDPPYGLSFMGKKWDHNVPSIEVWRECIRILRPGGHLLSFGGTRTYHRLVVAIEDAGFEIRDQVQWIYGQGFPKSLNIGLSADKSLGLQLDRGTAIKRGVNNPPNQTKSASETPKYEAKSDFAKQWSGWGTALKPANEPICLARKPLEKGLTVAANVQKWGTGGLNIDESRIAAVDQSALDAAVKRMTGNAANAGEFQNSKHIKPNSAQGRFPANVILDEAAGEMLDAQTGELKNGGQNATSRTGKIIKANAYGIYKEVAAPSNFVGDTGGASRFFYCAKASTSERNAGCEGMAEVWVATQNEGDAKEYKSEGRTASKKGGLKRNFHPTVKPVKLMEYLVKLITPPGGIVLDPFMGSGTTGIAAVKLDALFIGIEMNEDYFKIAKSRIDAAVHEKAIALF